MGKTITTGIIGCGYWGPNLVRNLNALPDCTVKAVADLNTARLDHMKALYPHVETTTEASRLIADPEIGAIVIAAPVRYHFDLARESLEAGKHTFIEKPMAASLEIFSPLQRALLCTLLQQGWRRHPIPFIQARFSVASRNAFSILSAPDLHNPLP